VEYEVGCVLEDLLRCVHAVCELGVDPDCEPCLDLLLQNVFHRISCARINRRNRRNRPCMETNL
jgi:hypothetical protein